MPLNLIPDGQPRRLNRIKMIKDLVVGLTYAETMQLAEQLRHATVAAGYNDDEWARRLHRWATERPMDAGPDFDAPEAA